MNKREFFDSLARSWEKEHRHEGKDEKLALLTSYFLLKPQDTILDAGCGTGRLIPYLRKKIGEQGVLVELDFSLEMLRIARGKGGEKSLFFVLADVERAPFKKETFDAIVCFSLFPHLSHKKKALRVFHFLLKKGHFLYIAHTMSRRELNSFHARVKGPVKRDFLPGENTMRKLLVEVGFREVEIIDRPSLYLARAKS